MATIPTIPQLQEKQNQEITWSTSPNKFLAQIQPKTELDVLRSSNKSLAMMAIQEGIVKVKALLTILIADAVDFLSVGKSMSAQQIAQTIDLLLEDYSLYKPDYFVLFFKKFKKGEYVKFYDRIDGNLIFEALAKFDYEYQSGLEHLRIQEQKLRDKGLHPDQQEQPLQIQSPNDVPVPMPDYIKEAYLKITYRPVVVSEKPSRTPEQLIVDGFITDFNEIQKANDDCRGGKRYVFFYGAPGKAMDISAYIEWRITGGEKIAFLPKITKQFKP